MKTNSIARALAAFLLFIVSAAEAKTTILAGTEPGATGRTLVICGEATATVRHALLPRRDGTPEIFWSSVGTSRNDGLAAHFLYNEWGVAICSIGAGGGEVSARAITHVRTARAGVDALTKLIRENGGGRSGEFTVADTNEIWSLTVRDGTCGAAQRVPVDQAVVRPDGSVETFVCELADEPCDTVIRATIGCPGETTSRTYRPFAGILPHDTVFGAKALERLENHDLPSPDRLKVAFFVGMGARSNGFVTFLRLLASSPEVELLPLDADLVRAGALSKADILVVPGGSALLMKGDLGADGAARIRDFVRAGGGYYGACAGCCLSLDADREPDCGIGLVPYGFLRHFGQRLMPIALNKKGAAALGLQPGVRQILYSFGPALLPVEPSDSDMRSETWGTYAEDFRDGRSHYSMKDMTALVGGTYGKGRVFSIALHPESFDWTHDILRGGLRYVSGREVTFPVRPRTFRALTVAYLSSKICGLGAAQEILQMDAYPEVDLFPFVADDEIRPIGPADVAILPDGYPDWYAYHAKRLKLALDAFVARGGRVFGWGEGARYLPANGVAYPSSTAVRHAILASRPEVNELSESKRSNGR